MKLNIGSGNKKKEGYINVDALDWDGNTDIKHDLTEFPYPFKDGEVEEIYCCETLEHISYRYTLSVLMEFYRILKKGGKLFIQVPDCGKMMEYYVDNKICTCVNHKDMGYGFRANPDCSNCGGKAIINTNRWLFAFTGAGKHQFDYHLNIFTKERLEEVLEMAGFKNIEFKDDIYKLKVKCEKL